jgi:hypothetical protein
MQAAVAMIAFGLNVDPVSTGEVETFLVFDTISKQPRV